MPEPVNKTTNAAEAVLKPEELKGGSAWRLLLFSLFVFVVMLVGYFGVLFGYKPFLKREIEAVEQQIAELSVSVSQEEQEGFLRFYFQLVNLQKLLNQHVNGSKAFPAIEANTNKLVYYVSMNIDTATAGISLTGVAQSYEVFVQQLVAYRQMRQAEAFEVAGVTLNTDGTVSFGVNLLLKPEVFN